MHSLYPEIEPFQTHSLATDSVHKLYVEECGRPDGIPVIFLHGGPGSGCKENHRRYFNPEKYRVILFDQRGCNRSTPQGSTESNTTSDLIEDMERIRRHLGVDHWMVFGGSWGATLGLLYAEIFPEKVTGLILRGTFLARRQDLDWFAKDGVNRIFPDYWEEFISVISPEERDDLIAAYHGRIHGNEGDEKKRFARNWSDWASRVVTWNLKEEKEEEHDEETILHEASIEIHYAKNWYFLAENKILNDCDRLPKVSTIIIHGRRDLTCLPEASWSLHKHLPHSELVILPDAGHLAGEPAMVDALVQATDRMAELISRT